MKYYLFHPIAFLAALWNRIKFEWHMKRHGFYYTDKPCLGKKLWIVETKIAPCPNMPFPIFFKRDPK